MHHYDTPILDNPYDHKRGINVEASDEFNIPMWDQGTKIIFSTCVTEQYKLDK